MVVRSKISANIRFLLSALLCIKWINDTSNKLTKWSLVTSSPRKNTRLLYSYEKDVQTVEYIVKHKYVINVLGTTMWKNIEFDNVCIICSWQSMKQRYTRYIKLDITSGFAKFPFLTAENLKLLRIGLNIEYIDSKEKETIRLKFQDQRMYDNL